MASSLFSNTQSVTYKKSDKGEDLFFVFLIFLRRFENWSDTQTIGDVLSRILPFLKMYQIYTSTYDEIVHNTKQKIEKLTFFGRHKEFLRPRTVTRKKNSEQFLQH